MDFTNWLTKNFKYRGLVKRDEYKSTFIQIIGFSLIALGVFYISLFLFPYISIFSNDNDTLSSDGIAISFFIIMLGLAFAFPELLKGDKGDGMSTMRIVVFMMSNVICLLLLKIGWRSGLTSLQEIGLDETWVGFIAFVFGAKATQYYFENKLPKPTGETTPKDPTATAPEMPPVAAGMQEAVKIANLAIAQNKNLKVTHPNIENMLVGSMVIEGHNVHCVDVHLANAVTPTQLPAFLPVQLENNEFLVVPVQIIANIGAARTNSSRGDSITNATNAGAPGTLGCFLSDKKGKNIYALSCCHVFTDDQWMEYSGTNVPLDTITDNNTGETLGNWVFGIMNSTFDFGYVKINTPTAVTPSGLGKGRKVRDLDILHRTRVSFNGAIHQEAHAVIRNHTCTRSIYYGNTLIKISNLILISTEGNLAPSAPGDSGSLVYTANEKEPIGIIVAADVVFSYVIPITSILAHTGLKIY